MFKTLVQLTENYPERENSSPVDKGDQGNHEILFLFGRTLSNAQCVVECISIDASWRRAGQGTMSIYRIHAHRHSRLRGAFHLPG